MVNKNGTLFHLIYWMTLLLESSRAQTTGPTFTSAVSIVPGSTSLISISKATSINLTSDFITGLPTSTPTLIITKQPTEIIFVTATSSSTINNVNSIPTNKSSSNQLSATDLGAIIGGCAGGLLLLSLFTAFCCIRRKKKRAKKEYELSRGISASMIFNKDAYKQQPVIEEHPPPIQPYNTNTIKRYNINNDKTLVEEEEQQIPPVILFTDAHNNSTSPQPRQLNRTTSQKTARLSKYNFLSQAFSQMRTSAYGVQQEEKNHASEDDFEDQLSSAPEPSYQKNDSMILSPYEFAGNQHKGKYKMYSMYGDTSTEGHITQPPSASTFFDPHNRESSVTVGTLHAPLFHQQHKDHPTPSKFYTSGVITPNINRDSLISDVSQYPTKTKNNHSNKPYPYF